MLWPQAYLDAPTKGTSRARVAGILRDVKARTRMIMEKEHQWGPFTTEDTGKHQAGHVRAAAVGDLAARNALVNVPQGALFILQDGPDYTLQIYDEASWKNTGIIRHGDLLNLNHADAHTQYVRVNDAHKADWDFDVGGNDLTSEGGVAQTRHGFILGHHAFSATTPHTDWHLRQAMANDISGTVFFSPLAVDITVDSIDAGLGAGRDGLCYFPGLFLTPNLRITTGGDPADFRIAAYNLDHVGLPNTDEFGLIIRGPHPFTARLRGYRVRIAEL